MDVCLVPHGSSKMPRNAAGHLWDQLTLIVAAASEPYHPGAALSVGAF